MLRVRVVVVDDELVVVLTPREHVAPVRLVVRDHRQPVAPRFDDGAHVVQARVAPDVRRL